MLLSFPESLNNSPEKKILPLCSAFHLRDGQVVVCVEGDVDGDGRLEEPAALVGPDEDARRQGAHAVGGLLILRRRGDILALSQPGLMDRNTLSFGSLHKSLSEKKREVTWPAWLACAKLCPSLL